MTWAEGTGGDVVEDITDGDGVTWRYHKFTSVGSGTFTATSSGKVECLIVAGGGAGGRGFSGTIANPFIAGGGGGGAGGVLVDEATVTPGSFTIVVGGGGVRPTAASGLRGGSGANSTTFGLTAIGGGGGGRFRTDSNDNNRGGSGGSGGGAGRGITNGGGAGTTGQGFTGGEGTGATVSNFTQRGGGGGGAGDHGGWGLAKYGGGDGGPGREWPAGSGNFYGGGGGGASTGPESGAGSFGAGGIGGGGRSYGDVPSVRPENGAPNTGGGGGGGGVPVVGGINGDGGSGIVIVRYVIDGFPSPPDLRFVIATGGEVTDEVEGNDIWRYHTFTRPGRNAFVISNLPDTTPIEYLVVGGGGGGGASSSSTTGGNGGGGGGAGGFLTGTGTLSLGELVVTVGIGGAKIAGTNTSQRGVSGANSTFLTDTAIGGGGGGIGLNTAGGQGLPGGSGGGAGNKRFSSTGPGAGTPGQGFDGGFGSGSTHTNQRGGGGGGAFEAGEDSVITAGSQRGGNGGSGLEWLAGSENYYAGGGGGSGVATDVTAERIGLGGLGGGGNGRSATSAPEDGIDGTGGGGGGGAEFRGTSAGGDGVVVVRYVLTQAGPTPATVTTGEATDITKTSATLNGTLDDDGDDPEGAAVGFAVATSADDSDVFFFTETLGTTVGAYSAEVTDLTAGTEYFFKIFALNSEGLADGDWVSFTTEAGDPPTVFNAGVDFGGTFAEFAGLITDQGEGPVTGRGFVYNVAPDPVIGQEGVINVPAGSGVGGFSTRVSGLDQEVTYYWRAYGTNVEAGTAYADTESFTTTVAGAPEQLSLTMTTVDEDTIPSVGTARFQIDPEDTGTYTWEIAGEVEPPYFGGVILNAVVDGVPAGQVIFPDGQFGETVAIQFTPAPNWFGQLTFSYRVSNGFAFSDWEQATVTVNPVPDPPGPVVGNFPDFDEDTTATFDLTWTDVDDLPPGTLVASPNYFLQMRPTAGGAWRWLTEGSPTARLTNVAVRVLNYSSTELRGTFRVEPDANYYGPYGAQVRIAKKLENDTYLFGPARNLAGTIAPVPDAPTRPQPNRMPTAKVGQTVSGRFTTFDPDIEDTSWTFEISAPDADTWGSSLVIPDVGTLTVIDTDLADQAAQVQLVQETGGATDLRYQFDLRVTDSSGLISPVQRVTGLITLPTATVFLQKVTRSSPAVITPLTPLVEVFDLNVTDSIDGIGGASVTVSTDEVRRRAAQLGIPAAELLEPGTVELVVAIGTQLVFVGPVGEVEWSATRDSITIDARGLLSYLEERRIGSGTKSFVSEDISDIMWELVDDAQGQTFGDYAFTDNVTTAGTNLTVEFESRTRILEALRSLSQVDGGPDFWIDPDRQLNTAAARGQDRRSLIRLTPGMMEGATWTNRDEQLATVVTVIGGEDGIGGFFQGTAVTTDSGALAKYGRRERLIEVRELTSDQQCEDYAARVVAEQARRSETIRLDIVVTPDRPFSIRDLEVGDILTVDLRAPDLGQVIGAYRVVNRRLNLVSETADSYRVRLDLVPAPFVSSVLVKVKARHNASIVERLAQLNSQQE